MKRAIAIVLFLLMGTGAIVLTLMVFTSSDSPQSGSRSLSNPTNDLVKPPNYTDIETRLDNTAWREERQGIPYYEYVDHLWDTLNTSDTPLDLLRSLPFETLTLGHFENEEAFSHAILRRTMSGNPVTLDKSARERAFRFVEEQGLRLEHSEWRHVAFAPSINDQPQSQLRFAMHLLRPDPETRYALRGSLTVHWRASRDTRTPKIASLHLTEAELLSRTGLPPFGHVIPADLTPTQEKLAFDPNLQVHDLDRDGRQEIIVSRINRVYWNQGQGQFRPAPLCDFPLSFLHNTLLADFDGDGLTDLLAVNTDELALYGGTPTGTFPSPPRRQPLPEAPLANPFALTAGDIDQDQDLDLWLMQYRPPFQDGQMPSPYYDANDGPPSYLLLNDGTGNFQDRTSELGLASKRHRRTYSASFVDFDDDQDLDLAIVSDFAGLDLYQNNGQGHFTDITAQVLRVHHAFGMALGVGDFDLNGHLDLFMVGMNSPTADRLNALGLMVTDHPLNAEMSRAMTHGNRLFLQARDGTFTQPRSNPELARTGWSWGIAPGDFDNDGDEDIYLVNGHISGASVADYEAEFWLHDIYLGDASDNPELAKHFEAKHTAFNATGGSFGGHEYNRFFINEGPRGFIEAAYLLGLALTKDCRNLVCADLDGDGKLEWLTTTFEAWPQAKQALHLFPNFSENSAHWIGAHLRPAPGIPVVGAVAVISTTQGRQTRHVITGDSYRSQSPTTIHFGIGTLTKVNTLTVTWPNRQTTTLSNPSLNTYHNLSPEP